MKKISKILSAIKKIADDMIKKNLSEIERIREYSVIKTLINELRDVNKEYNDDDGYVDEKLDDLEKCTGAIAYIDITNGHSDRQHLSWLHGAIISLKSDMCFGDIVKAYK